MIKIILENNKKIKLKDLINYSLKLYTEQNLDFDSKNVSTDLIIFLKERFKNYMKEKNIRQDIVESSTSSYNIDDILKIYKKVNMLNNIISKEIGSDVIFIYKRASNILVNETNKNDFEISDSADPGLFKNDFEKKLYKKIHDIRKEFSSISRENDYKGLLKSLASAKLEVTEFFENVKVNDADETIKKNRLELLKMLCKTFDNYFNFSKIENL